ncbi:hypothetical protein ACHQM5_021969 [Ranunculus cassubicifolius]
MDLPSDQVMRDVELVGAEAQNSSKMDQQGSKMLRFAGGETMNVPQSFKFDGTNYTDKAIEYICLENSTEEISPLLAELCERHGIDRNRIELSCPLPGNSGKASIPDGRNVIPEITQVELFPGNDWVF